VGLAESACAGIKFEKLFSYRYLQHHDVEDSYEFSFENGSFAALLHLVEKRALNRGIPVLYVNPANTSKRCSRCGCFGQRVRKRFACPQCGMVIHADVNAALNIAAASSFSDKAELHRMRTSRRQMRRLARAGLKPAQCPEVFCNREMLAGLEKGQEISAGA
jgi:putative transposase